MARSKDRTLFLLRLRGQNLFLEESDGEAGFSGLGADTSLFGTEDEASRRQERLMQPDSAEVVPVQLHFSPGAAGRVAAQAPRAGV